MATKPLSEVTIFAHLPDGRNHGFVPAGKLKVSRSAIANSEGLAFGYGRIYARKAEAISVDPVALPLVGDESDFDDKFPLPGLTEFGGIRDAAPDAWGRRMIEAKLKAKANALDEFTYLVEAGSDRVGALDVRPKIQDAQGAGVTSTQNLHYLLQVAEAVDIGEDVPAALEPYLGIPPSAGGARPKATVRDDDGVLWLAKFPAARDTDNEAVKEIAALKLAQNAGLTVPPLRYEVIGGKPVMLIRRFDRYWQQPGQGLPSGKWGFETQPEEGLVEGRIHQVSALTLLGCAEGDSPTKSYADIARAIRSYCHPQYIAHNNRELFARMVFNIFVTNDDDHLRNHAFLFDAAVKGWRLSPLYDVVPMARVAHERRLHLGVGKEGKLATLDNAMSEYATFLPNRTEAIEVIRTVWTATRPWMECFEAQGADPKLIETMKLAIRPLDAIASKELQKVIRNTP